MPVTSGTPRWQKIATFVLLATILVLCVFVYARVGTTNASVQATNQSSARRDCVTAYNADFTEVVRDRDALNVSLNEQLATALLNAQVGLRADEAAVTKFRETKAALDKAATAVEALPKLDDAVNHGYVLNGHRHAPCPG